MSSPLSLDEMQKFIADQKPKKALPPRGRLSSKGWNVSICGNEVRVYRKCRRKKKLRRKKGDKIMGFSDASRRNLLSLINRIDLDACTRQLFVTLTYPDAIPCLDYATRKKHLYLFHRAMEKKLGKQTPVIWRIEWKQRKQGSLIGKMMPHFHLLYLQVSFLDQYFVREVWRSAIGHDDGPLCTDVKEVTGSDGAARYIAKYLSKLPSLDIAVYRNNSRVRGRHWGIKRKNLVPFCPEIVVLNMPDESVDFVRTMGLELLSWYDEFSCGGYRYFSREVSEQFRSWFGET
jgi:hypothetical protein